MTSNINKSKRKKKVKSNLPKELFYKGERIYTIKEALKFLKVGQTKLYHEIKCNRIKSIKLGRRRFIPQSGIDAWVRKEVSPLNKEILVRTIVPLWLAIALCVVVVVYIMFF